MFLQSYRRHCTTALIYNAGWQQKSCLKSQRVVVVEFRMPPLTVTSVNGTLLKKHNGVYWPAEPEETPHASQYQSIVTLRQNLFSFLRSWLFLVFQAIFRGSVPLQLSNWDRQHPQQPEPPGAAQPGETDVTAAAQWLTRCVALNNFSSAVFLLHILNMRLLCSWSHARLRPLLLLHLLKQTGLLTPQCNSWRQTSATTELHSWPMSKSTRAERR